MKVTKDFIEGMKKYDKPEDSSMGLIEACSKNPVLFAKKMLGMDLFAWQKKAIMSVENEQDLYKYFTVVCSRQIGKTEIAAIYALWASLFNRYPTGVTTSSAIGVIAAQDDQAKNLIERIKDRIDLMNDIFNTEYVNDEGKPVFGKDFVKDLIDDKKPNNTSTITFKNPSDLEGPKEFFKGAQGNCQIRSFPPTRVVRGKTFSLVIVDEAAISDAITEDFFKKALKPTGDLSNAPFLLLSTPDGPEGLFYRFVNPDGIYDEREDIKVLNFTIDAIKHEDIERWERIIKELDIEKADGNTNAVRQEYYCEFVKTQSTYFDPDAVRDCFDPGLERVSRYKDSCDMGVDFGGERTSRSVITISTFNKEDETVQRLYHKTYEPGEDENLYSDIKELMHIFNIDRVIPDECPAGMFLINKMKKAGINIHPMNFSRDKVKKYGAFRSLLNKRKIKTYPDKDLQTEMFALENRPTRSRTIIGAPAGYSDDLIDSFLMSTYFYVEEEDKTGVVDFSELRRKTKKYAPKKTSYKQTLKELKEKRRRKETGGFWNDWR